MLQFLPLPAFWLYFYVLGRLPARKTLATRQVVIAVASYALLFFAAGPATFAFYLCLGLVIVLVGRLLQSLESARARKAVVAVAIVGVTAVILAFLGFRPYI